MNSGIVKKIRACPGVCIFYTIMPVPESIHFFVNDFSYPVEISQGLVLQ